VFAAILDTCVLWPSLQRDFLLSLAIEGSYRPLWSSAILAELEEHEALKRIERGADPEEARRRAVHLIEQMRQAFDDAEVAGWEKLEGSYGLPDPDDEHVVAAAEIGGAGVIVTENFRDMPVELIPSTIQLQTPAEFARNTVAINPAAARRAVEQMAERFRNPPQSIDQVLNDLDSRYGFTNAVEMICEA
jgi:predicted nucleic acid-binding protein